MMQQPKLTIITVCFNAASTIANTFASVLAQQVSDIEHWLIDGNSTDNSVALIQAYQKQAPYPVHYVSEPDNGLYDAMNKGLQKARGEFIHFLNADDVYASNDVLAKLLPQLAQNQVYYGDVLFQQTELVTLRFGPDMRLAQERLYPHNLCQPGMIVANKCYRQVGQFDLQYQAAADFEMTLRLVEQFPAGYLRQAITKMAYGGESDQQACLGMKECYMISRQYGVPCWQAWLSYVTRRLRWQLRYCFPGLYQHVRLHAQRMGRGMRG